MTREWVLPARMYFNEKCHGEADTPLHRAILTFDAMGIYDPANRLYDEERQFVLDEKIKTAGDVRRLAKWALTVDFDDDHEGATSAWVEINAYMRDPANGLPCPPLFDMDDPQALREACIEVFERLPCEDYP